jgi:NADH-quinone oxidoreductase subunit C
MHWGITSFFFETQAQTDAFLFYRLSPKFILTITAKPTAFGIVVSSKFLLSVCKILKLHYNFNLALDVVAADYPSLLKRFQLNVILRKNQFSLFYCPIMLSVNVKIMCGTQDVPISLTNLFNSSIWPEREVLDLFGLLFSNHPDLRRLLTDYGFSSFPLRKDFPLTGYLEVRYDDSKQRVVVEEVELQQEFRAFDFLNPWVITV